ncbi:MAG: oligosaccharide flippase family protein [Clostridiales bacterium]|nr:oligosaccharide flippase family protein [Clostridiales bacterium]
MKKQRKGIAFNVSMLYIMNIAKLIFPLITLPYLTRVLSVDCYGVVSYVKATMVYAQLIVDFGFMLSGVKAITEARESLTKIGQITGNIIAAKGTLSLAAFAVIITAAFFIEILRENMLYTILAFIPIALSTFLLEFLFRGMELMHIITIRYVIMKTISVGLTLVLVRGNEDILWIPILDILSSLVAIILTLIEVKRLGIKISFVNSVKSGWQSLKISSVYFVSEAATTVFGALNTILVGIFMDRVDVAYWAVCLQLVSAVRAMYTPINNGIYPQMIKTKDINVIKKVIKIFLPIVIGGCIIVMVFAEPILSIAGGVKYAAAAPVMRCLVPVLLFSFPAMLFGWPTLGALGKAKETTKTTLGAAIVQITGLVILGLTDNFTILLVALMKSFTEVCLMSFRLGYCWKFKDEFNHIDNEEGK